MTYRFNNTFRKRMSETEFDSLPESEREEIFRHIREKFWTNIAEGWSVQICVKKICDQIDISEKIIRRVTKQKNFIELLKVMKYDEKHQISFQNFLRRANK